MTFDLENARAADEVLPYPLDAKEIWVSGKGQMHINPPNASSIFFTLSDLCEFRNIFHGQAAEIERLRARDRQAAAAIVAMAEGAKQHVLKTHTIMKNVFDEADSLAGYCEELENIVITKDARIKEFESSLDEAEALTKKNADLMNAYLARIAELEDALVEGLTNFLHYRASCCDPARRCPYAKECDDCSTWDACGHVEKFRSEARQLLQAEGKIGPDADAKPHCWRITEERRDAIMKMSSIRTIIFCPDCGASMEFIDIVEPMAVLRGMLEEADHDKP